MSDGCDNLEEYAFEIIEKLKSLKKFTKDAIEEILAVTLTFEPAGNPYCKFYSGEPLYGPFSKVEYREPGIGARTTSRMVIMEVREGVKIGIKDVWKRYGIGTISDIIPEIPPEGKVYYEYKYDFQTVAFGFGGRSHQLKSVTIEKEDQGRKNKE